MGLFGLLKASIFAFTVVSSHPTPDAKDLLALLHSSKSTERLSAIQQLAKLPPTPEISESLVDALNDKDPRVVGQAAAHWGKIAAKHDYVYEEAASKTGSKHTEAETGIVRDKWQAWQMHLVDELGRCIDSPDATLSKAAARSLALMGDSAERAFSPGFRCATGEELYLSFKADLKFAEKTAGKETLLRELFRDKDAQVVYTAAWQLSKVSPKWLESRIPALSRDARSECRIVAIGFGSKRLALSLIGDPDERVRKCAAWSIMNEKGVVELLAPHFSNGTVAFRRGVMTLLRYHRGDVPGSLIQAALLDENSSVRAAAIIYATSHEFPVSESYILDSLKHPSTRVRLYATSFLWRLDSETARPLAVSLLADSDGEVRSYATDFLQDKASLEIIPHVLAAFRRYRDSKAYGIAAIIRTVGPPAKKYVRQMLVGPLPCMREAGVLAAVETIGQGAVDELIKAADDRSPAVRTAVADCLSDISDPRIPALVSRLLEDKEQSVVMAAIITAKQVGGHEILDALHRLQTSDNDLISEEAKSAIRTLVKGPDAAGE